MVFCSNIHNCMKFLVMLIYINEIKKVASPHPNDFYWANKTYLRAIVIFIKTQFWSNIFLLSKNIGYIIVQRFTCHNRQSFSKVLYLHFKHSLFFKISYLIFKHYFIIIRPKNIGHQTFCLIKCNFLLLGGNYTLSFHPYHVNIKQWTCLNLIFEQSIANFRDINIKIWFGAAKNIDPGQTARMCRVA